MPYNIAKQHNILIIGEPLGDFHGYYQNIDDQKIIHINTRIPRVFHKYAIAFLVYGAINNPNDVLYLKKTDQNYNALEREAALYALKLLFDDLPKEYLRACESDKKQIKEMINRIFVQDVHLKQN